MSLAGDAEIHHVQNFSADVLVNQRSCDNPFIQDSIWPFFPKTQLRTLGVKRMAIVNPYLEVP